VGRRGPRGLVVFLFLRDIRAPYLGAGIPLSAIPPSGS
jgi:hypothetical protein